MLSVPKLVASGAVGTLVRIVQLGLALSTRRLRGIILLLVVITGCHHTDGIMSVGALVALGALAAGKELALLCLVLVVLLLRNFFTHFKNKIYLLPLRGAVSI